MTSHDDKDNILKQKIEIMAKVSPFNLLNDNILRQLAEVAVYKSYPPETYILRQGEESKGLLFILVQGRAQVSALNEFGKETVTGFKNPLDFFGITVFLGDEKYPASIKTLEETTCLLLSQDTFEMALSHNPEFAAIFSQILARRLKDLYRKFMLEVPLEDGEEIQEQPLRKKVKEVMISQVKTCPKKQQAWKIAANMRDKRVTSLVVLDDNNHKPQGIITEKDLVIKSLSLGEKGLNLTAEKIMSTNLVSCLPDDFAYQALLLMVKNNIKQILVTDKSNRLQGIVTMRDLMKLRTTGTLSIVNSIENAADINDLMTALKEVDQVVKALVMERAFASEICPLVSELYDRITRKIVSSAEMILKEKGFGPPPVPYSFIVMGSGGRQEQFGRTDQDNAIIYQDPAKGAESKTKEYFLNLGEEIVSGLEKCGFKKCLGHVMSSNHEWCRSLSEWKQTVSYWVKDLEDTNVRNMTIFLDFRHIYGSSRLAEDLRHYTSFLFQGSPIALNHLAENDLRQRAPINFLKHIITERTGENKGKVNLKAAASVHIVDCIRIFALKEGINEVSTFKRMAELAGAKAINPDEVEFFSGAFETILMMRIRDTLQKLGQNAEPDNYIDPLNLSKRNQSLLKESFMIVNRLQNLTAKSFRSHTID